MAYTVLGIPSATVGCKGWRGEGWEAVRGRMLAWVVVCLLLVGAKAGGEAWREDWEEEWSQREERFAFPSVEQEEQCQGEKLVLRAGEGTSIRSHRGYGYQPYPQDYRCRWIFQVSRDLADLSPGTDVQPVLCDLAVVCYLRTRMGPKVD